MEVPDIEDKIQKEKLCIKPRKIANQNIVYRLWQRQTHSMKPGTFWHESRNFYKHVFPNFTVDKVDKPAFYLRKFSPDGRHFLVFSCNRTAVEVYDFQGCDAAENLLFETDEEEVICRRPAESYSEERKAFVQNVREQLFTTFFKLRHQIPVAHEGQHLNRECSLFTDDSRFAIVMSAIAIHPQSHAHIPFDEARPNNESVDFNQKYRLEHFKLHVVDVKAGVVTDSKRFMWDKIFPSHNQGLYLYQTTLAVLSVQHQNIHIFKLTGEGKLIETHVIGRFCFDDDELIYSQVGSPSGASERPFFEEPINSLKHRILVFLYKDAMKKGAVYVRRFYQHFDFLKSLKLWKMQLLDADHLLIKYASEDVVTSRVQSADVGAQPSFFIIYNIPDAKVISVYENTSRELLNIFEQYSELLRPVTPNLPSPWQQGGSWQQQIAAERNIYLRQIQQRVKDTIINAKHGGHTEAVKRLLAQLPIPAQSHSCSPYLDLSLFNYDDKYISAFERPKGCGMHPIRFYERDSGIMKFSIHTGLNGPTVLRRLVAFTFHPYQPFAISVQRTDAEYSVNFHFRHVLPGDRKPK